MKQSSMIRQTCVLALAGMLWAGCDDKKQPANPPPASPPPTAPPPPDVTPKAGATGGAVGNATADKTGGGGLAATGPSTTQTPDPKSTASKDKSADPAIAPVASAKQAEQSKQAQDLIAGAIQAIKENRLEDAQASLDKVDGMKSSLPKATQEQVKTVRGNLDNVRKLQSPDLAGAASDPDNK